MTFDILCFVAGGPEAFDNVQDGLGQPVRRHLAPVIEP
jgi:hypothetical protein